MVKKDLDLIGSFLKNLKDDFDKKLKSIQLNHGNDGLDGSDGKDGEDGQAGLNGSDGSNGLDGSDGIDGIKGFDGLDGKDGLGIDVPIWSEGVYRKGMIITHNIGQYFEALEDTAGEPSHSKSWKRVGTAGFRQTGGYKKDFDYQNGDMFTKDFSTFMFQNNKEHLIAARSKAIPGPKGDDVEVKKEIAEIKKDYNEQILELWAVINTLSEDKLS